MQTLIIIIILIAVFSFCAPASYCFHVKKKTGVAATYLAIASFVLALLIVCVGAIIADQM